MYSVEIIAGGPAEVGVVLDSCCSEPMKSMPSCPNYGKWGVVSQREGEERGGGERRKGRRREGSGWENERAIEGRWKNRSRDDRKKRVERKGGGKK